MDNTYDFHISAHHFVEDVLHLTKGIKCLYYVKLHDKQTEELKYHKAGRSRDIIERMKKYDLEYYVGIVRIFIVDAMVEAEQVMHKYLKKCGYKIIKGNEYYDIINCDENRILDDIRESIKDFVADEIDPLNIDENVELKINEAKKRMNNGGILKAFNIYAATSIHKYGYVLPIKINEFQGYNGYNLSSLVTYYREKYDSIEDEKYKNYITKHVNKINDILGYNILELGGSGGKAEDTDILINTLKQYILENNHSPHKEDEEKYKITKKDGTIEYRYNNILITSLRTSFNRYMRSNTEYYKSFLQFFWDNGFYKLYREHSVNNNFATYHKARLYNKMKWCTNYIFTHQGNMPTSTSEDEFYYDYLEERIVTESEYMTNNCDDKRYYVSTFTNAIYWTLRDNINSEQFYLYPSLLKYRKELIGLINRYYPQLGLTYNDYKTNYEGYYDDYMYDYKNDNPEPDILAFNRNTEINSMPRIDKRLKECLTQQRSVITKRKTLKNLLLNLRDINRTYKPQPIDNYENIDVDINNMISSCTTDDEKITILNIHFTKMNKVILRLNQEINNIRSYFNGTIITKSDDEINTFNIEFNNTNITQTEKHNKIIEYTLMPGEYGQSGICELSLDILVMLHLQRFNDTDLKLPSRTSSSLRVSRHQIRCIQDGEKYYGEVEDDVNVIDNNKYVYVNLSRNLDYILEHDTPRRLSLRKRLINEVYHESLEELIAFRNKTQSFINRIINHIPRNVARNRKFDNDEIITTDGCKTSLFKVLQQLGQAVGRVCKQEIPPSKDTARGHIKDLLENHILEIRDELQKHMDEILQSKLCIRIENGKNQSCISWIVKLNKYLEKHTWN